MSGGKSSIRKSIATGRWQGELEPRPPRLRIEDPIARPGAVGQVGGDPGRGDADDPLRRIQPGFDRTPDRQQDHADGAAAWARARRTSTTTTPSAWATRRRPRRSRTPTSTGAARRRSPPCPTPSSTRRRWSARRAHQGAPAGLEGGHPGRPDRHHAARRRQSGRAARRRRGGALGASRRSHAGSPHQQQRAGTPVPYSTPRPRDRGRTPQPLAPRARLCEPRAARVLVSEGWAMSGEQAIAAIGSQEPDDYRLEPDTHALRLKPEAGPLRRVLKRPEIAHIIERFETADRAAIRWQQIYWWLSKLAFFSRFLAITVGALLLLRYLQAPVGWQASAGWLPSLGLGVEYSLIALSFLATLVLTIVQPFEKWMHQRGFAENARIDLFDRVLGSSRSRAPGSCPFCRCSSNTFAATSWPCKSCSIEPAERGVRAPPARRRCGVGSRSRSWHWRRSLLPSACLQRGGPTTCLPRSLRWPRSAAKTPPTPSYWFSASSLRRCQPAFFPAISLFQSQPSLRVALRGQRRQPGFPWREIPGRGAQGGSRWRSRRGGRLRGAGADARFPRCIATGCTRATSRGT